MNKLKNSFFSNITFWKIAIFLFVMVTTINITIYFIGDKTMLNFLDHPNKIDTTINGKNIFNNYKLKENEIEHSGTLIIRILENGLKPIKFDGIFVSCATKKPLEFFKPISEISVQIDDCESTLINCRLTEKRWLLDMYVQPSTLTNYDLEINGKRISSQFIEVSNNGKSLNYFILLRRIK